VIHMGLLDTIRRYLEAYNQPSIGHVGSFGFVYDKTEHKLLSIHDEMREVTRILAMMPELYTSLYHLSLLTVGNGLRFESDDPREVEFLNKWVELRPSLREE